jgi:UDP-N-acetylmuramyl pentapeptide synthase
MLVTCYFIFLLFQESDGGSVVLCCGIPILIIVVAIILTVNEQKKLRLKQEEELLRQQKEIQKAKENYESSLKILKTDPINADLKQKTLRLGRRYSELTRQFHSGDKSITIYDEMKVMNDINAACAAAAVNFSMPSSPRIESVEERLEKLVSLKERGLIDEHEFQAKRQKILDDI